MRLLHKGGLFTQLGVRLVLAKDALPLGLLGQRRGRTVLPESGRWTVRPCPDLIALAMTHPHLEGSPRWQKSSQAMYLPILCI